MNRHPGNELAEIAGILNKAHFTDETVPFKPPNRPMTRYPSSTRNDIEAQQQRKERVKHWQTHDVLDEGLYQPKSRLAIQRATDARLRLVQAKKEMAQNVRNELEEFSMIRRAKLAEERETRQRESRSRVEAWEEERQQRKREVERAARIREANEMIEQAQKMMALRERQREELDRLKTLKDRMLEMQAKRLIPPALPSRFSAFQGPSQPLAETVFKLELQRRKEKEALNKKRDTIYDRHLQKLEQSRQTAQALLNTRPEPKKRLPTVEHTAEQLRQLVNETQAQEAARIKHEVLLLEKLHGRINN